jgi:hypothetical protein
VGADEARALLEERARLAQKLADLDDESERLVRAVQRVGGPSSAPRPFTGAAPMLVGSSSDLDFEMRRLQARMNELVADISRRELALQDLDRPRAYRWLIWLVVVAVLVGAAAGIVLAVR